jgi:hypothetical protein
VLRVARLFQHFAAAGPELLEQSGYWRNRQRQVSFREAKLSGANSALEIAREEKSAADGDPRGCVAPVSSISPNLWNFLGNLYQSRPNGTRAPHINLPTALV